MDFEKFKDEGMLDKIVGEFLSPEVINRYRKEYGAEKCDKDIDSYEELYKTVGYAFLFLGRAIAETIGDIRVCETASVPPSPIKHVKSESLLIDHAWYWLCNFQIKMDEKMISLPPFPGLYSASEKEFVFCPIVEKEIAADTPGLVVFGPIPKAPIFPSDLYAQIEPPFDL
jgi:hypothetical protein